MNGNGVVERLPSHTVVLEARNLTAGYDHIAVVRNLNLQLRAGEIVALFGPNGAGKTTTLLTLAGDLPAIDGEVVWDGSPTHAALYKRARRGLALVPEERFLLMSMSVRDNLLLGKGGIAPAVDLFPELKTILNRRAGLLSGGEQQMLTLARAIATQPRALLIDELSLGLAPLIVDRLLTRLTEVVRSVGVSVLLVEQQARRALKAADRWYLMRHGELIGEGDRHSGTEGLEAAYLADAV